MDAFYPLDTSSFDGTNICGMNSGFSGDSSIQCFGQEHFASLLRMGPVTSYLGDEDFPCHQEASSYPIVLTFFFLTIPLNK